MKIAYQVNDNCENLTSMLDNKLDWNELAKINLYLETQNHKTTDEQHIDNDRGQGDESFDAKEETLETYDANVNCINSSASLNIDPQNNQTHGSDTNVITNIEKCNPIIQSPLNMKQIKVAKSKDGAENFLMTLMKTNLSGILHEGLLDSVLPYMIPKPALSQPIIKKYITNTELKKASSLSNNIETGAIMSTIHKEKDKDKSKSNKRSME